MASPNEEASNPTPSSQSPPNDRFTTHWKGPTDPLALDYQAAHPGISFFGGKGVRKLGPDFFIVDGMGAPDLRSLRAANLASDAEVRARHAADPEFDTGTSLVNFNWLTATRGEKLRTSVAHRNAYRAKLDRAREKLEYAKHVVEGTDTLPVGLELETAQMDVLLLEKMLDCVDELERLCLAETELGWDWKRGIEEQKQVRQKQKKICQLLSDDLQLTQADLEHEQR
jgi:hypothetical protein